MCLFGGLKAQKDLYPFKDKQIGDEAQKEIAKSR